MVLVAILLSTSTFTIASTFAQSERTNQTMESAAQSANHTSEEVKEMISRWVLK